MRGDEIGRKAALAAIALLSLVAGCSSHRYYEANMLHAPMLTERHDLRLAASIDYGTVEGGSADGSYNIQAAYSPIKHVALTASHFRSRYTRGWKTDRVAMPED